MVPKLTVSGPTLDLGRNAFMKPASNQHYRQGDVLIERVGKILSTAIRQPTLPRIVLAHGEATGHHHALETSEPVDWWKEEDKDDRNRRLAGLTGKLYFSLPTGGTVTHQEHDSIVLPAGNYRVSRQREYSPEAEHDVMD